jgi:ectoine hydroxylase-related dioxygenase (phytanoyl-CoA dioxygenase family)
MSIAAGHKPLSADDVDFFNEHGYFLYRGQVFDASDLAGLGSIFEEHRQGDRDKLGDEFDTPHFQDERLLEFLLAPALLDLVECIVGPNIVLWSSHFICKDPLIGRATPWHEDSSYWMGRLSRYDKIVTVWLALDDVDRQNGCMQVIPGSHLEGGFSPYKGVDDSVNTFATEISDIDVSDAVAFELRRGQCSLHDGRIRHGAAANTSSRRRLGYTMRYLSADVEVFPEMNVGHRLWLARGEMAPNELVQTPRGQVTGGVG